MLEDRRRYRKAYIRLWKNREFRQLPDAEKVMTCYLLFGPQSNRLGLFHVSYGLGMEDLNWTLPLFRKRAEKVCHTFGWHLDQAVNVVWIPSWWDFNDVRDNFKVMQGALADLHEVPDSPLIDKFLSHMDFVPSGLRYLFENLSAKRAIPRKVFDSGIQEQEQEQEQEQKQEQEQEEESAATSATPAIVTDPVVFEFPTVGPTPTWVLRQSQVQKWRVFYPALDVVAVCRSALAWCDANPQKRKTGAGMVRFLDRWLRTENDKGHATRPALVTGSLKTAGNDAALASFVARHRRES